MADTTASATCSILLLNEERCGAEHTWEIVWEDLGGRERTERVCGDHFRVTAEMRAESTWTGKIQARYLDA